MVKRQYTHNPATAQPSIEVREFIRELVGEDMIRDVNAEVNAMREAKGLKPYDFSAWLH